MNQLTSYAIRDIAISLGFFNTNENRNVFILEKESNLSPAFLLQIVRRNNTARIDGGIGLFDREFEIVWARSLSKNERLIDKTLPVVLNCGNFRDIYTNSILDYTDSIEQIKYQLTVIKNVCAQFPNSYKQLEDCILLGEICEHAVSSYFHVSSYYIDSNLYLRKSIAYIQWIVSKYPTINSSLLGCFNGKELERISRLLESDELRRHFTELR